MSGQPADDRERLISEVRKLRTTMDRIAHTLEEQTGYAKGGSEQ